MADIDSGAPNQPTSPTPQETQKPEGDTTGEQKQTLSGLVKENVEPQSIPTPQEYKKSREALTEPELGIAFNKKVFAELEQEYPQLAEMLKTFQKLPDNIVFGSGVNFIFGKNGSGKSTLASSMYLLAKAGAQAEREKRKAVLRGDTTRYQEAEYKALDEALNPSSMGRYEIADLLKSGLAPEMVRRGAVKLTGFNQRDRGDGINPPVDMISVQDILGEQKSREAEYVADVYGHDRDRGIRRDSVYKETGASARQDLERKLAQTLEGRAPGSIIFLDEATMGLSPWRQEEYIRQLHKIAQEKNLIIIAPENSGYAWEGPYRRIHLSEPEKGLQIPDGKQLEQTPVNPLKESQEQLGPPSLEITIDKAKLAELAKNHPKFAAMLSTFQSLPETLSFSPGKTEIYGDNGEGKTTLLNTIKLLMDIKRFAGGTENDSPTPQEIQAQMDYTLNSQQTDDKLFLQSSGLASELIRSGTIVLGSHNNIPEGSWSGKRGLVYFNLIDLSGEITSDTLKVVEWAMESGGQTNPVQAARDFEKGHRADRLRQSTRQTVESYLKNLIEEKMLPGGFLFVDEIDGGISPDRQLPYSDQINKIAKEKGITIISTSNSYEGHQHPITPKLDLHDAPQDGIIPPRYAI